MDSKYIEKIHAALENTKKRDVFTRPGHTGPVFGVVNVLYIVFEIGHLIKKNERSRTSHSMKFRFKKINLLVVSAPMMLMIHEVTFHDHAESKIIIQDQKTQNLFFCTF